MVYFVNNVGDTRFNIVKPDEDYYLEFTSINILEDAELLINSCQDNWIEQYKGKANVYIEIWSKLVLLEAGNIGINGEVYSLN